MHHISFLYPSPLNPRQQILLYLSPLLTCPVPPLMYLHHSSQLLCVSEFNILSIVWLKKIFPISHWIYYLMTPRQWKEDELGLLSQDDSSFGSGGYCLKASIEPKGVIIKTHNRGTNQSGDETSVFPWRRYIRAKSKPTVEQRIGCRGITVNADQSPDI